MSTTAVIASIVPALITFITCVIVVRTCERDTSSHPRLLSIFSALLGAAVIGVTWAVYFGLYLLFS